MRNLIPLVVVGVVVVGCGGMEPVEPEEGIPAATWSGRRGLLFEGEGAIGDDVQVRTSVDAASEAVSVSGLCRDDDASVTLLEQSGGQFSWVGSLECPAVSFGFCDSVVIAFSSATAYPSEDGLAVFAGGEATGCERTWPVSFSFVGRR